MSKKFFVSKQMNGRTYTSQVLFQNGVYVWASNGRVPPADAISEYEIDKLPDFDKDLHDKAREQATLSFMSDYQEAMQNHKPSVEEMHGMQAAFGPGATVINIFTKKKYKV